MKVFAGLVVATSATVDRLGLRNSWPANEYAPHCGCQIIVDPKDYGGLINSTCTIRFPYADKEKRYGRNDRSDPHFVSIASTYMVGRNRDDIENKIFGPDAFRFTGFDEVSNPDALDILVFYEAADCARPDRDIAEVPDLPHSERWEVRNLSSTQLDAMCEFDLECVPNGSALPGVYLGNFNYDIARSVQTYTVPIYGLEKDESATFLITDYDYEDNYCMLADVHQGHGTVSGCSNNVTGECSNAITFKHDKDHNGLLEYFQFEAVSLVNNPFCVEMPKHHGDDYKWKTPSPWDTQENSQSTSQNAKENEDFRNKL